MLDPLPGKQFHAGTMRSATDRRSHGWLHPLAISGQWSLAHGRDRLIPEPLKPGSPHIYSDDSVNNPWGENSSVENYVKKAMSLPGGSAYSKPERERSLSRMVAMKSVSRAYRGGHVVPYINDVEDEGSVSISTSNPDNLERWKSDKLPGYRLVGRNYHPEFYEDVLETAVQDPIPGIEGDTVLYHSVRQSINADRHVDIPLGFHRDSLYKRTPTRETAGENLKRHNAFLSRDDKAPSVMLGLMRERAPEYDG
jgi:hypothetical protein